MSSQTHSARLLFLLAALAYAGLTHDVASLDLFELGEEERLTQPSRAQQAPSRRALAPRHADAGVLGAALSSLGEVRVMAHALVFDGPGEEVERLRSLAEQLDRPGTEEMDIRARRVPYGAVTQVAAQLRRALTPLRVAPEERGRRDRAGLLVVDETSGHLLCAAHPETQTLIDRLTSIS